MSSEDDGELEMIRRAMSGDETAMQLFLLQHRAAILAYLERRVPRWLRATVEPADIQQDVMVEAFRNMSSFRVQGRGMAVRWLLRITRNHLISMIRQHQAQQRDRRRLDDVLGDEFEGDEAVVRLLQDLAVSERTPSLSAVGHELIATLQRCLDQLPDDYRDAVRFRYLEGLSVRETAARMCKGESCVTMLCGRGLRMLKMQLQSFSRHM